MGHEASPVSEISYTTRSSIAIIICTTTVATELANCILAATARAIRSKGQNLYTWHGNNKIQIRKQGGEPLALEEGFLKRTRTTSQSFSR